jgi:hypothetical protein
LKVMESSGNGNNYLPRSPSNTLPYFKARSFSEAEDY